MNKIINTTSSPQEPIRKS